jgi:hypothetical protein
MIQFDEEWFREENQTRFAWRYGVIRFGIPFGLFFSVALVLSNDISNHPLLHKIAIVAGMTLFGGPLLGWFFGHITWGIMRAELVRRRSRKSNLENRIADLEAAVQENTETVKKLTETVKNLNQPNPENREIDSNS